MSWGRLPKFLYSDLKKHSVLSREEFNDIHAKWKTTGEQQHFDKLLHHNLRLVIYTIRTRIYVPDSYTAEDLFQSAYFGLKRAIEKFDPKFEGTFSTYATHWIIRDCINDLENNRSIIRTPYQYRLELAHYFKAINNIESDNPSPKEIYDWCVDNKVNISDRTTPEHIEKTLQQHRTSKTNLDDDRYLNTVDGETMTLLDWFNPDTEDVVERELISEDTTAQLEKVLHARNINDRERTVIFYRFGLFGHRLLNCKEIAHILGISGCRVQQIEAKTLRKLRIHTDLEELMKNET